MSKMYEVNLPVFKKGDDMAHALKVHENDTAGALRNQAAVYKHASDICDRLAAISEKNPEFKITTADTHVIVVDGPEPLLETLEKERLLYASDFGDDEEDEEDDNEDELDDE